MRLQNNRYSFLSYAYDHSYYLWGLDLSGTPQGAGGVGGLLAVIDDNANTYMPVYDANGNITDYVDSSGNAVAHYAYDAYGNVTEYVNGNNGSTAARYRYDAFGNTIAQSGPMSPNMTQRFSTKYYDGEYLGTDMYYYGFRIYAPRFHRWLSTDPIGERGGLNFYGFCGNDPINKWDYLGMKPTKESGATELATAADKMKALCDKYFPEDKDTNKKNDPNKQRRCKCKEDSEKITDALVKLWKDEFGKGPWDDNLIINGNLSDTIGGYYCWDWSSGFLSAANSVGSSVWSAKERYFEKTKGSACHYATKIFIKNKGKEAEITVDDGFFEDGLVHEFGWPNRNDYKEYLNIKKPPRRVLLPKK